MKYGVWAVRSAASIFGRAEAWCKEDGELLMFTTEERANELANALNKSNTSANVRYFVREMEPEFGDVTRMMEG